MTHQHCTHHHVSQQLNSSGTVVFTATSLSSSIFTAALDGDSNRVHKILSSGVSVNVTDEYGYTALHFASRWSRDDVVKLLLSHGANPNASVCGFPPIVRAAFCGATNVVRMLIEAGADMNAVDTTDGRTALHKAYHQRHNETVAFLLQSGADTTILDKYGNMCINL